MNFGPINKVGGGKRLNVAFSRARVTMTIFTSIYSTDLKVTENSPEGLIAFRDFLKYAEGNDLNSESEETIAAGFAKAGILQSICNVITEQGFQCVPMVGHSDFHVDIAVVDPYEPTQYLMGILLDGDGYKKTKNTRDREVGQIGVLKNLGWVLYRVWTIDWWDNREKVLNKLLILLEELRAESQKKYEAEVAKAADLAAEQAKRTEEELALRTELEKQAAEVIADEQEAETLEKEAQVIVETPAVVVSSKTEDKQAEVPIEEEQRELPENESNQLSDVVTPVPYVFAELPKDILSAGDYIAADNKAEIGKRALEIVEAEAPILREVLIRRLMSSFGVNKSSAVLEATEKALKAVKIKSTKQKGIVFCWAANQDPKAYYGLRVSNERSGDEICPQERRNAIVYALQTKGELSKDDLIKEASVILGYKRLGKNLEAALASGIQFARSSGAIVYVPGGTFKLP